MASSSLCGQRECRATALVCRSRRGKVKNRQRRRRRRRQRAAAGGDRRSLPRRAGRLGSPVACGSARVTRGRRQTAAAAGAGSRQTDDGRWAIPRTRLRLERSEAFARSAIVARQPGGLGRRPKTNCKPVLPQEGRPPSEGLRPPHALRVRWPCRWRSSSSDRQRQSESSQWQAGQGSAVVWARS